MKSEQFLFSTIERRKKKSILPISKFAVIRIDSSIHYIYFISAKLAKFHRLNLREDKLANNFEKEMFGRMRIRKYIRKEARQLGGKTCERKLGHGGSHRVAFRKSFPPRTDLDSSLVRSANFIERKLLDAESTLQSR